MGKVRTRLVKRLAEELAYTYPDKFTTDYEHNKRMVDLLVEGISKRMRNRVAGYITHLMSRGLIQVGEEEATG
ncbi:30S ribosomal protein S17e [Candidatus Bathyarchaeota archaeon]|nr:MAG: 30S ribosomal protein S17e [Candidatus Bathyarchaeota archaeon]